MVSSKLDLLLTDFQPQPSLTTTVTEVVPASRRAAALSAVAQAWGLAAENASEDEDDEDKGLLPTKPAPGQSKPLPPRPASSSAGTAASRKPPAPRPSSELRAWDEEGEEDARLNKSAAVRPRKRMAVQRNRGKQD